MIETSNEKILLVLLPFWDPQIPPLGISCLKSFLQQQGFRVKTLDTNTREEFRKIYYRYYKILEKYLPANKKGNFYNMGSVVIRNHMMAHLEYTDEEQYIQLVKILIYKNFNYEFRDSWVRELSAVLDEFYPMLEEYFLGLLEEERPGILGFSVFNGTLAASVFASRLTRQRYPQIKIIMGGGVFADQLGAGTADLDFFVEKTKNHVDKIIIGEGEELFLKYLQGDLKETQKVYTLKDIGTRAVNLSAVKIPDYTDFDLLSYPYLAAYGSRSCPYQCSFCSETVYWGAYRKKKAKQILEEFIQLNNRYSYRLFMLTDSLLNPIVSGLAGEVLQSGESFYWDGFLRADKPVCDPANTMSWRRGGFYRAKLGIESGSPKILEKMGKKITIQQIKEAVSSLAYAGIKTTTFWVIGHPGETEEDFQMTLDLVAQLKDYIYEADCNAFYYHLTGQSSSSQWMEENKPELLYPAWAKDMLISQTWRLNAEPPREETLERVNRFIRHCRELGIPNPYLIDDIHEADQRWKKLHKNAVPALMDLRDKKNHIHESKHIKELSFADNLLQEDNDWLL